MKRISLISLLLLATTSFLFAQEFKGKVLLAPGISYTKSSYFEEYDGEKYDESSYTRFTIDVPVGYFVSDQWAVGITPAYYRGLNKYSYMQGGDKVESQYTTKLYMIGLFARHYTQLTDRLNVFGEFTASLGSGTEKRLNYGQPEENYKLSSYGFALVPGLNFKLTDSMFLELGIGSLNYSSSRTENKDNPDDSPVDHHNSFGFSFNTVSFGLMFLI